MLNEERVKHMVKLSFYETKKGSEEIKINSYRRKTYLRLNLLWSFLWVTIAYVALIGLIAITFVWNLVEKLGRFQITVILAALAGIYLVILIAYLIKTKHIYRKKHAKAFHHVQKFKEDLAQLEKMYEKEDQHGKTI